MRRILSIVVALAVLASPLSVEAKGGKGNGSKGNNGNHYGWYKGNPGYGFPAPYTTYYGPRYFNGYPAYNYYGYGYQPYGYYPMYYRNYGVAPGYFFNFDD